MLAFNTRFTLLKIGICSTVMRSSREIRTRGSDQKPGTQNEKRGSNPPRLALLSQRRPINNSSATVGKDDVPKFGDSPYDGEDDAFPDQDTEHISRNQSTVLTWVEELVRVKVLACVSDIGQPDVEADGENADGKVEPRDWTDKCQQNFS